MPLPPAYTWWAKHDGLFHISFLTAAQLLSVSMSLSLLCTYSNSILWILDDFKRWFLDFVTSTCTSGAWSIRQRFLKWSATHVGGVVHIASVYAHSAAQTEEVVTVQELECANLVNKRDKVAAFFAASLWNRVEPQWHTWRSSQRVCLHGNRRVQVVLLHNTRRRTMISK